MSLFVLVNICKYTNKCCCCVFILLLFTAGGFWGCEDFGWVDKMINVYRTFQDNCARTCRHKHTRNLFFPSAKPVCCIFLRQSDELTNYFHKSVIFFINQKLVLCMKTCKKKMAATFSRVYIFALFCLRNNPKPKQAINQRQIRFKNILPPDWFTVCN